MGITKTTIGKLIGGTAAALLINFSVLAETVENHLRRSGHNYNIRCYRKLRYHNRSL